MHDDDELDDVFEGTLPPGVGAAPNRRILIIDDNPRIHDDFRTILVRENEDDSYLADLEAELFGAPETPRGAAAPTFDLDSAYQGREGLEKVRTALAEGRPYALAFVDVRMPPGWDGIETIRHLWDADPQLQVVICTAYSDYSWEETLERLPEPERFLILKKPFDTVVVRQLAHSLTEKWERQRVSGDEMRQLRERVAGLGASEHPAAGPPVEPAPAREPIREALSGMAALLDALRGRTDEAPASVPLSAEEAELDELLRELPRTVERAMGGLYRVAAEVGELRHLQPPPPAHEGMADLNRLVARTLAESIASWGEVATLSSDHAPVPPLPYPPDEIATVVRELLDNAVLAMTHAAAPTDPKGSLAVRTRVEDGAVALTISDSGPGVPAEAREQVFAAWFSTWDRDGQGLVVVRQIVEARGGSVTVDDVPEGGARFVVRWPIA